MEADREPRIERAFGAVLMERAGAIACVEPTERLHLEALGDVMQVLIRPAGPGDARRRAFAAACTALAGATSCAWNSGVFAPTVVSDPASLTASLERDLRSTPRDPLLLGGLLRASATPFSFRDQSGEARRIEPDDVGREVGKLFASEVRANRVVVAPRGPYATAGGFGVVLPEGIPHVVAAAFARTASTQLGCRVDIRTAYECVSGLWRHLAPESVADETRLTEVARALSASATLPAAAALLAQGAALSLRDTSVRPRWSFAIVPPHGTPMRIGPPEGNSEGSWAVAGVPASEWPRESTAELRLLSAFGGASSLVLPRVQRPDFEADVVAAMVRVEQDTDHLIVCTGVPGRRETVVARKAWLRATATGT